MHYTKKYQGESILSVVTNKYKIDHTEETDFQETIVLNDLKIGDFIKNSNLFDLNNGDVTNISIATPISGEEENQLIPLGDTS